MDGHVVGVLGGGQLGLMLAQAAQLLGIKVAILDSEMAPAKEVGHPGQHVTGSFTTASDVRQLSSKCDVMTFEIEHVDTRILEELEKEQSHLPDTQWSRVQPSWRTVRIIQDKYHQKQHLAQHDIPTARSVAIERSEPQGLQEIADQLGYPLMLKSRTGAYDGRGNCPVQSASDIESALRTLSGRPLYAEQWANFKLELAVMVVKTIPDASTSGWETTTLAYPVVETVHEDSICKLVYVPARGLKKSTLQHAATLARRAVSTFQGTGVFGVELFLLQDDTLVVNEIAPRPHNSGHYTIEACRMSQYKAHLCAILPALATTLKPSNTELRTRDTHAVMLNILGGPMPDSHLLVARAAQNVLGGEADVHLYNKGQGRPGRKMGHITIMGSTMEECEAKMRPLIAWVDAVRQHKSDTGLSAAESAKRIAATANKLIQERVTPQPKPLIGVTMGSDTDLDTLRPGLQILEQLKAECGIHFEVGITSAHRTPQFMLDYAKAAAGRGLKVIIAAAGGAAHLPGMVSSDTSLPVIGVPVKASAFDGQDSLYAIVQMPRGIPVATMGVGNSTNAALLAARIIGTSDPKVQAWVERHQKKMEEENLAKGERLRKVGWQDYRKQESKHY